MSHPPAVLDHTGRVLVSVAAAAVVAGYKSARTAWPSLHRAGMPRVLVDGRAYVGLGEWRATLARQATASASGTSP